MRKRPAEGIGGGKAARELGVFRFTASGQPFLLRQIFPGRHLTLSGRWIMLTTESIFQRKMGLFSGGIEE